VICLTKHFQPRVSADNRELAAELMKSRCAFGRSGAPIRVYQRLPAAENARFAQFAVSGCPTNVPNAIALTSKTRRMAKPAA
jgi:hypothetical protein